MMERKRMWKSLENIISDYYSNMFTSQEPSVENMNEVLKHVKSTSSEKNAELL